MKNIKRKGHQSINELQITFFFAYFVICLPILLRGVIKEFDIAIYRTLATISISMAISNYWVHSLNAPSMALPRQVTLCVINRAGY